MGRDEAAGAQLMRVEGIGELTHHGTYWRLAYDRCRHVQEFARLELDDAQVRDDPQRAALEVQRHYAQCLTCKVNRKSAPHEQARVDTVSVAIGYLQQAMAAALQVDPADLMR